MKRILVEHETKYSYQGEVELAHHLAHLRPITNAYQDVISSEIIIHPIPNAHEQNLDVFGNHRDFFSYHQAHDSLSVTAHLEVISKDMDQTMIDACSVTWEEIRAQLHYAAGKPFRSACEFIYPSPYVPYVSDIQAYAQISFTPGRKMVEAAFDFCQRIYQDFQYSPQSTEVNTPVWEAFKNRVGVCQDFAHILITGIRCLGLSARYVSGYLLTKPPAGQEKLRGADASHAWVSVYCPGISGDWLELDPTNNMLANSNHVRLALGRDFGDVSPLRGVIRGGEHKMHVAVTAEERPLDAEFQLC